MEYITIIERIKATINIPISTKNNFGIFLPKKRTRKNPNNGRKRMIRDKVIFKFSDINYSLSLFISSTLTFENLLYIFSTIASAIAASAAAKIITNSA